MISTPVHSPARPALILLLVVMLSCDAPVPPPAEDMIHAATLTKEYPDPITDSTFIRQKHRETAGHSSAADDVLVDKHSKPNFPTPLPSIAASNPHAIQASSATPISEATPLSDKTSTNQGHLHRSWSEMLGRYVDAQGQVHYAAWKEDETQLHLYLNQLAHTNPEELTHSEAIAYWINTYNAFTVRLILDHYPVSSIRDLYDGNPWDARWIELAGHTYSLNQIEHEILFKKYPDPRYHFALVCAAKSCPPLLNKAWKAEDLETTLASRTRAFVRDARFNRYTSKEAVVSQLFEWYGHHFGDVRSYLNKYLSTPLPDDVLIRFEPYDWTLNERL